MIPTLTPAPLWSIPAGTLAVTTEGATLALGLPATVSATGVVMGGTIAIGPDVSALTAARIGGSTVPFTVVGQTVVMPTAPAFDDYTLSLTFTLNPSFSLLNGSLPLGVTLGAEGRIEGVVGNVVPLAGSIARNFRFTVRATHRNEVRDRTLIIRSGWFDSLPVFDPSFAAAYEQIGTTTGGSPFFAYMLPAVQQGSAYTFAFSATDEDGPPPQATLDVITPRIAEGFSYGLPSALSFNAAGRRIEGVVTVGAPVGTYLFDLVLQGGGRISAALPVTQRASDTPIDPVLVVSWVTAPGGLGTVRDGEIVALSVRADTTTGAPVTYEVLGEGAAALLARGIRLDPATGDFHGRLTAPAAERLTFVVRARSGLAFDDREFSISTTARYGATTRLAIVSMTLPDHGKAMLDAYSFSSGSVFRSRGDGEDADHGLPPRAELYLIGGLAGTAAQVEAATRDGMTGLPRRDYHGPRDLILGPHRLFVARIGARIAYEVLARTLIDPLGDSGGFDDNGEVVPIPHPQRPDLGPVKPQTLRNARFDLIDALGIHGTDAELLPLWLRSRQRDNTIPGFVPCLPVAFLRAGAGAAALTAALPLEASGDYANGRVLRFMGYRIEVMERGANPPRRAFTLVPLDAP